MAKIGTTEEANIQIIKNTIGPQLQQNKKVRVTTIFGASFSIDYCIINSVIPENSKGTIVLPTGFGSGWGGIAKLGLDFAKLDYKVCMISMPGYGNSDNPFLPCYVIDKTRRDDVDILAKFIKKVLPHDTIYPVGHSMSAEIITNLAYYYPQLVSSIVLLAPAGFEKRGKIELALKFISNGLRHGIAFHGDCVWAELKKFLPKEKSSFLPFNRIKQRLGEWKRLCKNEALEVFKKIPPQIPIACIWGSKDFVFPMKKSALAEMDMRKRIHCEKIELPLWHNMTMYGSDQTANAINDFLKRV